MNKSFSNLLVNIATLVGMGPAVKTSDVIWAASELPGCCGIRVQKGFDYKGSNGAELFTDAQITELQSRWGDQAYKPRLATTIIADRQGRAPASNTGQGMANVLLPRLGFEPVYDFRNGPDGNYLRLWLRPGAHSVTKEEINNG